MRKQFDIKYRPQIESGEYTVENRDGDIVTILEWDIFIHGMDHMMLIRYNDKYEFVNYNGRVNRTGQDCNLDLFIITPEPELSEFERKVADVIDLWHEDYVQWSKPGAPAHNYPDQIKPDAAELLSLAREQFIKDGYVIEKKAFHDAVENISDKHLAEMSVEYSLHCKAENGTRHAIMNWEAFQKVAQKFIDIGKAEALKDLPRWKKCEHEMHTLTHLLIRSIDAMWIGESVKVGQYYIPTNDLILKLPGFKEDGHE